MSEDKRWQFELEEYLRQGEPEQAEKSEAWQIAIGLQQVDGLKTSAYLLDTAKEHIEGKISIDEAQKRIQSCTLNCPLDELAILRLIIENPNITKKRLQIELEIRTNR